MKSILFVVAHPDDVANGMGGTAYLLKDKYKLFVLCMTKGERGVKGWSMKKTASVRENEEATACSILGARLKFGNRIDKELYADATTCKQVASLIRKLKPSAVFTIWHIDYHRDHSAVAEIVKKAVTIADIPVEIIYCEEAECQTSLFTTDYYVDISKVIDKKLEMIRCHKCQNRNDAMARAFLKKSIRRGKESGFPHAESFRVLFYHKKGKKSVLSSVGAQRNEQ
jgi:LmbE family N-acetylglucosaminyl deacetylase